MAFLYRLAFWLLAALWLLITIPLLTTAGENNLTLITIRFVSEDVFGWALWGGVVIALWLVGVLRGRARFKRRVRQFEALSGSLNEGIILVGGRRRVRWHNVAAEPLIGDGLDDNLAALVERARKSKRSVLQTLPASESGLYAVQVMPLERGLTAILCRPVQPLGGQSAFYENFIRRIVHDMRNPLAAIIGHASNLSQSPNIEPEAWRKSIRTVEDEAQRLTRLVDSMLFDARLAYVPLQMQRFDLSDMLEEAIYAQDERALREGKTLHMDMPSTPMPIDADRDLLVRAFENLIDNSLKYSGVNGRLNIRLEEDAGGYVVTFEDNGEGIPPEYLPDRIFEPLVRARSQGGGSGLGLSIVRKIVEMHGGAVRAQSRVGVGTTMTVHLPKVG